MTNLVAPSRRRFLLGAGALLAAPSIVRVASLMPVSVIEPAYAGEVWWRAVVLMAERQGWQQIAMVNGGVLLAAHQNYVDDILFPDGKIEA